MILTWDEVRLSFMKDASCYNPGYYTALWEAIRAQLQEAPRHICDAGCGAGYLSLELAKHCEKVTAVDLSEAATALLRQNAQGLSNLTVRTGDLARLSPEEAYDAMVFCYFGRTPEILKLAKAQCCGTLVMVTRNYTQHRFSLHPTAFDRDTVAYSRSVMEKAGIPYTFAPCSLEFGQPFRSLDAAVQFFSIYGGAPAEKAEVAEKLVPTDDAAFPYYLSSTKQMGILTVQTKDIP